MFQNAKLSNYATHFFYSTRQRKQQNIDSEVNIETLKHFTIKHYNTTSQLF